MQPSPPDVLAFFGMEKNPFYMINSGEEFFQSSEFRKAYSMIEYALKHNALIAVIGDLGSGKTNAVREAQFSLENVEGLRAEFLMIDNEDKEGMRISSVIDAFLQKFDISRMPPSMERRTWAVRYQLSRAVKEGRRICVVIDEAQRLSGHFLKSLKGLHEQSRFAHYSSLFSVVLLGHKQLEEKYQRVARDVWDRLDAGNLVRMGNMTPHEVSDYIAHRLETAGHPDLFGESARLAVGRLVSSPLAINGVCWRILEAACVDNEKHISEHSVLTAYDRSALRQMLGLSMLDIAQRSGIGKTSVADVMEGGGGPKSKEAVDRVLSEAAKGM